MKLVLDTANLDEIKNYLTYLPVHGVTTNPSILAKEKNINVINHLNDIRELIGSNRSLHVQVIGTTYDDILDDAYKILSQIADDVFIKVPVTKEGLKAIQTLKRDNVNITATAVYSKIQAFLAMDSGVDYIAPYVNRMMNLDSNPYDLISSVSSKIEKLNKPTKLLGASFKSIDQVIQATEAGSHYVTVGSEVINSFTLDNNVKSAVQKFEADWNSAFNSKLFK